jgi:hypothetical protein
MDDESGRDELGRRVERIEESEKKYEDRGVDLA